jgi:hypothetical protein
MTVTVGFRWSRGVMTSSSKSTPPYSTAHTITQTFILCIILENIPPPNQHLSYIVYNTLTSLAGAAVDTGGSGGGGAYSSVGGTAYMPGSSVSGGTS